ncbi:MAG: peroxide stress protein YaaA [Pseudomonadota bacterium]|nr:peroxide stress protein YaaA [Pseudomonadota bacterium]
MLALLSPAKKQVFDKNKKNTISSEIMFRQEAGELVSLLKRLSSDELGKLMSISPTLADLNKKRYENFDPNFSNSAITTPAVLAFQGDAYQSLQALDFTHEDMKFCQHNLAIISGLYGLLKPYDLIQPYRLEMKTTLGNSKGNNLYDFWGNKVAERVLMALQQHKSKVVINLASDEYAKVLRHKQNIFPIITVDFKENKNNELKTIGIHAKKARGAMARFIIKNKIEDPSGILEFNTNGYVFNNDLSTAEKLVFIR